LLIADLAQTNHCAAQNASLRRSTDYAILFIAAVRPGLPRWTSVRPIQEGSNMEERDFFDEKPEQRTHTMTCPHCGQPGEYQIGWLVRRKKAQLPRGADERDRARFAKAQSYMVRTDDLVGCKNICCRKRFDVAGIQSVAFL
jgi:hypothetical protein